MQQVSDLSLWGAGAFGLVIGWIAYRTLRRSEGSRISDLVTVIAALGGGAVVNTQFAEPDLFAAYGLGLAAGFIGYFVVAWLVDRSERKADAAAARELAAAEEQSTEGQSGGGRSGTPTVPAQPGSRPGDWMGDVR
ncbi:hypothetical protein [Streptomyces sp. NPDC101166]|uniref:hypothetical protein n=1 Tax=Streptomyces sp. NPDC101166 TaxID=3366120 RepID=UPI0038158846